MPTNVVDRSADPGTARTKTRSSERSTTICRAATVVDPSPTTLDREKRTVRAVIATDSPVTVYDWENDVEYDEVLVPSGMVEPTRMKLRVDHNTYRSLDVIGSVFDFTITKRAVEATLRFSRASDVEPIFTRVAERDLDSVSIGARYLLRNTKWLEPGQSHEVGGVKYTARKIPMRIVLKWEPRETSIVDEPADSRALIRGAKNDRAKNGSRSDPLRSCKNGTRKQRGVNSSRNRATSTNDQSLGNETMPATTRKAKTNRGTKTTRRVRPADTTATTQRQKQYVEEVEDEVDETADEGDEDETATEQASESTRSKPATDKKVATVDAQAERKAERSRISRIMEMASGGENEVPQKLVERAINEGWSPAKAGQQFFLNLQNRSSKPTKQTGDGVNRAAAIHSVEGASIEALQCAVLLRAGYKLDNPVFGTDAAQIMFTRSKMDWLHRFNDDLKAKGNSDVERIVDVGRKMRHDSAVKTAERVLRLRGKRVSEDPEEMVQRAFSDSYLPRVFTALLNVGVIVGYAEYEDSTIGWVDSVDWNDFRMNQPIGLDSTSGMKKHTRGNKAKLVKMADFGEPYAIARYTGDLVFDDMDFIDGRIDVKSRIPQEMGRMAARLRPDLVYALLHNNPTLSDSTALFHADRGNIVTGAPLDVAGLTKAETAIGLASVKQANGNPRALNQMMGHVIVPRTHRAAAKVATASTKVITGSSIMVGDLNPHDGEYMLHSDARLDLGVENPDSGIFVAGDPTRWYGAERSGTNTLQAGYRQGTGRAPSIRSYVLTQGTWGMGWDVLHDIGVGIVQARGLVRCDVD